MRVLAVTGAERVPDVDAPTLKEAGVDLEFTNWRGMVAPPELTDADKQTLTKLVDDMHNSQEWKQAMEQNNFTDAYLPADRVRDLPRGRERACGRRAAGARDSPRPDGRHGSGRPERPARPASRPILNWRRRHREHVAGADAETARSSASSCSARRPGRAGAVGRLADQVRGRPGRCGRTEGRAVPRRRDVDRVRGRAGRGRAAGRPGRGRGRRGRRPVAPERLAHGGCCWWRRSWPTSC